MESMFVCQQSKVLSVMMYAKSTYCSDVLSQFLNSRQLKIFYTADQLINTKLIGSEIGSTEI